MTRDQGHVKHREHDKYKFDVRDRRSTSKNTGHPTTKSKQNESNNGNSPNNVKPISDVKNTSKSNHQSNQRVTDKVTGSNKPNTCRTNQTPDTSKEPNHRDSPSPVKQHKDRINKTITSKTTKHPPNKVNNTSNNKVTDSNNKT